MNAPSENILEALNQAAVAVEIPLAEVSAQDRPICVVGPPRSGTTLAVQLMISGLDVGWISNIAARFWANPAVGAFLQTQLDDPSFSSSMQSDLGRTSGALEPHEFGRFWLDSLQLDLLSLDDQDRPTDIDLEPLVADLRRVAFIFAKPVVYKSFVLPLVAAPLIDAIPDLLIVRVRRDLVDIASSLLRAHQQDPDSQSSWIGIRPQGWRALETLPIEERIAHQVVEVERCFDDLLGTLRAESVLEVDYRTLATEPDRFIDALVAAGVQRRTTQPSESTTNATLDKETMRRLTDSIQRLTDA